MPEEAIAAPLEETPVETGAETTETTSEGSESTATSAETTDAAKPGAEKPFEPPIQNGKLSQKAAATLQKLKSEDPALAKAFKAALYEQNALRNEFPEGLKAIRETMAQIEQFGGLERLPEIAGQAEELSRIDELYEKADPAFVDGMIESNPEAFKALVPVALEKFKAQNFEAYAALVAPDVLGWMDARGGVRDAIESLRELASSNADAAKYVQPLIQFYNSIFELSQKAGQKPAAAAKPAEAVNEREEQLNQREQALKTKEWDTQRGAIHKSAFNTAMSKIMEGKETPNDQQRAAIGTLYMSAMERQAKDPKHRQTVDRFLAANDVDGYKRYMAGWYKQNLPRALSSAVDAVVGRSKGSPPPPPKTAPASAKKPGQPQSQGSQFVPGSRPDTKLVDFARTSRDMFYKDKRAILKDGRKVSWS